MEKKSTKLTWGLFNISPRYPFNWLKHTIKDIGIMFKRIVFVVRHGYYPQCEWETFLYFIDMMDEILLFYRNERMGTPVFDSEDFYSEGGEERNTEHYNKMFDEMRECLSHMREDAITLEEQEKRKVWSDKFFKMFSEIFYHLWD